MQEDKLKTYNLTISWDETVQAWEAWGGAERYAPNAAGDTIPELFVSLAADWDEENR